jgi:tetratricopeptide (TPR) repeat protein
VEYTRAITLAPGYAQAYLERGLAYNHKDSYDKAIADFTEAIRLDPEDKDAYYFRGAAYVMGKDNWVQARADWRKALEIDPDYTDAREALNAARKVLNE